MAAQNEGGSHVIAERVHQKSGARRETAAPISAASFENRETGLTASSLKRIALSNVPGERFLLRVDGQIKRSFSSKEDTQPPGR